jgi:peptidyl-prolyl cis-trans isomerase B (cyclophilin B)
MKLVNALTVMLTLLSALYLSTSSATAAVKMATSHATGATAPIVVMNTVKGRIVIKLYPKEAPLTCANFIKLANQGFYNGLTFHRIANLNAPGDPTGPGKIVQGGDPKGNGSGGSKEAIKGEFIQNGVDNPLKLTAGAVAMARTSDPNSATSQFFICINPVPGLDGQYAVFGYVIKGLDVADKLEQGDKMTKVYMSKGK